MLARQLTLLSAPPSFDGAFVRMVHHPLPKGAWLDHLPGWLQGHEAVFDAVYAAAEWRQDRRPMYDRVVDVPRLQGHLDGPPPPMLQRMSDALSRRYDRRLSSIGMCLYRTGSDSVAWHGDRIRNRSDAVIAIVSLGEPRRFQLRPHGGGRARSFDLGWGDLLVMGGTCQANYEHCVPKVAAALPRMSVQFREASARSE